MPRIDPPSQLTAVLRQQLQARNGAAAQAQARNPAQAQIADARRADRQRVLRSRIAGLGCTDPERRRKAFRIFLELALLSELGEVLIHDPGFHLLVDRVHQLMSDDATLREPIEQAVDALLEPGAQE